MFSAQCNERLKCRGRDRRSDNLGKRTERYRDVFHYEWSARLLFDAVLGADLRLGVFEKCLFMLLLG